MAVFKGKNLFEKRVLPFKLSFPKNFSIASAVQPFCDNYCISVALPLGKVTPLINKLSRSRSHLWGNSTTVRTGRWSEATGSSTTWVDLTETFSPFGQLTKT